MNIQKSTLIGSTFSAATLAAAVSFAPTGAAAQQCGEPYTIVRGDTLSQIAKGIYGSARDFQIIYSANSAKIGSDPSRIEPGMRLDIPCLDAETTASTANSAAITIEKTTEALPAPEAGIIRVTTGSDWAPFNDHRLEQGGMIVEIANRALEVAPMGYDYKIDFIKDWSVQLQPLVTDHAYDIAIGWFHPNCEYIDILGEESQFRCNNFHWSEPMFEQIFGYFSQVGAPAVATHEELFGKTICRPVGYSTFMLEEKGLTEPNITFIRADTPEDCFQGLVDGEYDSVAIAADTGEGIITTMGFKDQIRHDEALSQVLTINGLIAKTNPNAELYLGQLNEGIIQLKDNGEWFEIVRRHLTAHREMTSS